MGTPSITSIVRAATDAQVSQFAIVLATGAPSNQSTITVLDSITGTFVNSTGGAAVLAVQVLSGGPAPSSVIWEAIVSAAIDEAITIDKTFADGLPIWHSSTQENPTGISGNYAATFTPGFGVGTSQPIVQMLVNGSTVLPATTGGTGALSVTFHAEPSSTRRY